MAVAVTLSGTLRFAGSFSDDVGLANLKAPATLSIDPRIAATEVTLTWSSEAKAIDGGSDVIDLNGGTLTDPGGNTITFDRIHAVGLVSLEASNAEMTLAIVGVGGLAVTDIAVPILPGGANFWYAPVGSETGIGDITITGTNTDTYSLLVIGDVA